MNTQNTDALAATIAGADFIAAKLLKTKSRIELCETLAWNDFELGWIKVFYRVIDGCDNAQTDESSDMYTIEAVFKGRKEISIRGVLEQEILEHLNKTNPLKVVFKTRA